MKVNLISFEKIIFQGEVDSLTVPGIMGRLTILPHHTPLITILEKGKIILRKGGKENFFPIEKGILEVNPKEINILLI